ncbi:MAG TPA: preprotein translocase subunit SecE [Micromonosporaceae bacterium]|nr:preprotein translocase subunit SecE [Micromonosporaceae bacterium]
MDDQELVDAVDDDDLVDDDLEDDLENDDDVDDVEDDEDDEFDEDDEDDEDDDAASAQGQSNGAVKRRSAVSRRDAVTPRRAKGTVNGKRVKADRVVSIGEASPSLGSRIARFFREVVAELRKVNWPSRKELLTYASVVIVFVVIMMTIVGLLDYGFAWVVGHVFAG